MPLKKQYSFSKGYLTIQHAISMVIVGTVILNYTGHHNSQTRGITIWNNSQGFEPGPLSDRIE